MSKKRRDVTTIYVVRHGESESNVYAQEYPDKPASHFGEFGSSLTAKGREQAKILAQRLVNIKFVAIFSSKLNRAKETAEIIAQTQGLPVITNQILRERFFGEPMSNVKKKEIEKALKVLSEEEKFTFRYFPNGENGHDVVTRFKAFLQEIVPTYQNKTILIVTHGYVMRSFLINEKFAKYDELPSGSIKNGGYFIVKTDGKTYTITDRYGITRNRGNDNEE